MDVVHVVCDFTRSFRISSLFVHRQFILFQKQRKDVHLYE